MLRIGVSFCRFAICGSKKRLSNFTYRSNRTYNSQKFLTLKFNWIPSFLADNITKPLAWTGLEMSVY